MMTMTRLIVDDDDDDDNFIQVPISITVAHKVKTSTNAGRSFRVPYPPSPGARIPSCLLWENKRKQTSHFNLTW